MKRDPTKTIVLRRNFAAEFVARYSEVKQLIREAVDENDVFAIREPKNPTALASNNPRRGSKKADRLNRKRRYVGLPPRKYEFKRLPEKVDEFMEWVSAQMDIGVLSTANGSAVATSGADAWSSLYIESAYKKGLIKARSDLKKAQSKLPKNQRSKLPPGLVATDDLSIGAAFNSAIHADRVGLLYTRTFEGMRGINEAAKTQMRQVLSKGLVEGRNPRSIARDLNNRVDKIGITRSKLISRTEVIYAHNSAALNTYDEASNVLGQDVLVEWDTAEDDRVRPAHEARHGEVLSRGQAEQLLGEPNCRCAVLPYLENDRKPPKKIPASMLEGRRSR